MKKNSILLISAALLMLAGCTVDELAGSKDGQIPVRLSVSQEATVTRAADGLYTNTTGFDGTESVEVYVNSSDKHATFTVGTPDGDKKSELTGTLYYPTTGDANLYAVYPNTSTESHTVKYDQTTEENYKASDLMYAKKTVAQEDKDDEQNLQFNHQLVKLKVVIVKAADVSQVTQVMMNNVKRQVSVTLGPSSMTLGTPATATGDEATGGDNILVSSSESSSPSAQTYTYAVVFPVQEWSDADFITVTADGKEATYKLTKNNFAAGSEYTLTLNINATALNNTVSITNWTGNESKCEVQPTVTETRYVATPVGAIPGLFTINADGDQVFFSKGNLQYQAKPSPTWRFAEHQYDYVGDASNGNVYVGTTKSNNASIGSSYTGWIDLFGWGTSGYQFVSGYGSAYQPYSTSTTYTDYGPSGNYNLTDTYANGDWGVNMGTGWRTLTGGSGGEWEYLFGTNSSNTRTTTSGILYAKATVNSVPGVILLPDDWSESYHSLTSYNTKNVAYDTNTITATEWTSDFEAHGCVFLPAAGSRNGGSVTSVGSYGFYWSSSARGKDRAYYVNFGSGLNLADYFFRCNGFSVRLVHDAN